MGNLHRATHNLEAAKRVYLEALGIIRKLAEKNPNTFLPDLAMTLINFSIFYTEGTIDKTASLTLVEEAIEILHQCTPTPTVQQYLQTSQQIKHFWEEQ